MRRISGRNGKCQALEKNENVTIRRRDVTPFINALTDINYNKLYVPKLNNIYNRIISSTNFNAHFSINMYVTLLSSTCFGP